MKQRVFALAKSGFQDCMERKGLDDSNIGEEDIICIQILTTFLPDEKEFYFKEDRPNVLSLRFDDCDLPVGGKLMGNGEPFTATPMSEEQARQIVDFVDSHLPTSASFFVHCRAGVSRSGAVGQYIAEKIGMSPEDWKNLNPECVPNQRILKLLREADIEKYGEISIFRP